jgi:hypothetical protein
MSPNTGGGGSCGILANELYTGAPINFGDPTPYLTDVKKASIVFLLLPFL